MIDFPASPTAGQLFVAPNGVTYQWSSTYTAWLPLSVTSAGQGDFCANISGVQSVSAAWVVLNTGPAVSGNSGGWYSGTPNFRYTPPAGRYFIYGSWNSSLAAASTLYVQIYKNGAALSPAAIGQAQVTSAGVPAQP